MLVKGTMDHPLFAPDAQAMAKMKLNNLIPSVSDPGKLTKALTGGGGTSGIVNGLLGGKAPAQPGAQPSQQPNTQDAVKGLLNSFGKKKKPQ